MHIIHHEQAMFYDTDAGGVIHNLAYLRMIEAARTRLAAKLGMGLREMAESGVFAVVCRTEIDYRRPGVLADDLEIRGWLDEVGRARFWCRFEVFRPSDGCVLAAARQSLALVKMPEGKPVRLPDGFGADLLAEG
ncbi:MAG: thioesterase family protein [Verrucomicrobiales bacterium]